MKIKSLLIAILSLPLCPIFAAGNAAETGKIIPISVRADAVHSMVLPASQAPRTSAAFVSAASIDRGHVALVDYTNLYCFDTQSASIRVVTRPKGLTGQWVPTGVAYQQKTGRLYVANYLGNNIIEGELNCAKAEFSVTSTISSQSTISPEGVAISDDGKTLAAANYDGGAVTTFTHTANGWTPLWTEKVAQAHGVAIVGADVYATGLAERKIIKFDARTGKQIARGGQLGADPTKTGLMWPTSLANLNGELILADAHTGYVCSIDIDTLQAKLCFGGNGIGPARFNMPYGAATHAGNLLIMSTFSSSVAEVHIDFTKQSVRLLHDWYWTGSKTLNPAYMEASAPPRTVAFRENPYSSVCIMPAWLPGMTCSYAGLANDTQDKFLRFPTDNSLFNAGGEVYFVHSFSGRSAHDTYFFSPQGHAILNLRLVQGVPYILLRRYGVGMQATDTTLMSPTTTVTKTQVRTEFDGEFAALSSRRNKAGIVPPGAAAPALGMGTEEFQMRLKASIAASKSAKGAKFLSAYLQCSGDECDGDELRKDALDYAGEQLQDRDILLDRAVVPCMLTNAQCGSIIWHALAR